MSTTPKNGLPSGTGWLPDRPDVRDLTHRSDKVQELLGKSTSRKLQQVAQDAAAGGTTRAASAPAQVDLRAWFSPVEDQGPIGSCTANAGAGVMEYYQRRVANKYIDSSRLFLYKVTREFLGFAGDTGAYLRSTMGALALFGVPPERYWTYDVARFDEEPSAFAYALAQSYQAETYYRLDPVGSTPDEVLAQIKNHLVAGLPPMFGFTVYQSIRHADSEAGGFIPFPGNEQVLGGHAIVAVGYDDTKVVPNPLDSSATRTGAFRIRNSWGTGWGEQGYGWLPYDYVLQGLAEDWWVMTLAEFADTTAFDQ